MGETPQSTGRYLLVTFSSLVEAGIFRRQRRESHTRVVTSTSPAEDPPLPQSLANVAVHLVFSTKDRQAYLKDQQLRSEIHKQLGGSSKTLDCPTIVVGGVEDHVHLLGRLCRTISISEWVKELKRVTSIWIKQRDSRLAAFQWQSGYGAFSVSQSEIDRVAAYIENQPEHHRQRDFKTEYRLLLERHGIEYDERYVWD
jgi:REP element-mobilizing transposase RayT